MLKLVLLLSFVMIATSQEPRRWIPQPKALPPSLTDSDPHTFETFCQEASSDPMDAGLSWPAPQRINEFVVEYVTTGGRAYEPSAAGQALEYWDGKAWIPIHAALDIDYGARRLYAPVEGSGTASWRYRFQPVSTDRIRVVLAQPRNENTWYRCFAIRGLRAGLSAEPFQGPGLRVTGSLPHLPPWLEPGANLAASQSGASLALGDPAEVHWPSRILVNRVETDAGTRRVSWWDGKAWRGVEPVEHSSAGIRFLPVSTTRLRVEAGRPVAEVRAYLDEHASQYFREIERARTDQLGARFRRQPQPDLAMMESLLLPLNFAKVPIGQPADLHETMVGWNGTLFMVEPQPAGSQEVEDRWFAFAAGPDKEVFGSDSMRTQLRYLDGHLPATVTTYRQGAIRFEERAWVTAPGLSPYGTAVEVLVSNQSNTRERAVLTLAMGRRAHDRPHPTPLSFYPNLTGYTLDRDERSVRAAGGEIILYAQIPGAWEGTKRENHIRYALALGPNETRVVRFFAPSVDVPLRSAEPLRNFDWDQSLQKFRAWWRAKLDGGMQLELPERQLNDIYRNLIAQALITTLDGDEVHYAAYVYEQYFGLEEGWVPVALAQYGHPAEAQKILSIMLSPTLMDKRNYHHQYRNGLEPWYASTTYRLTRDRAWLEKHVPDLQAAAEWTIRSIHQNRDARFGGILPRHVYGGDIGTAAYSFYSNATCWRGLNDTAVVFGELGRTAEAERYRREADQFRKRLEQLADSLVDRQSTPPFLPMSFDIGAGADYREKEPPYAMLGLNVPDSETWRYLGNYWNLFAPSFLEMKLFAPDDPRNSWVPDYMDAHGGILAGLVRFTIGLDSQYVKGYAENLLERGKRDEFATTLYGVFAHAMAQNLFTFPEVAGILPLRTSNAALWQEFQSNLWDWAFAGWQSRNCEGDPTAAGPGVALQLLRMALVRENTESDAQDTLRLLDGVPVHWFAPGRRIAVRNAPTFFGKVSLETDAAEGHITARIVREPGFRARATVLRLSDASGRSPRKVSVNGKQWTDFSGQGIRLPAGDRLQVIAEF